MPHLRSWRPVFLSYRVTPWNTAIPVLTQIGAWLRQLFVGLSVSESKCERAWACEPNCDIRHGSSLQHRPQFLRPNQIRLRTWMQPVAIQLRVRFAVLEHAVVD